MIQTQKTQTFHAIYAGGTPRKAIRRFNRDKWVSYIPVFTDHDACRLFWDCYCKESGEDIVWAISTKTPEDWK